MALWLCSYVAMWLYGNVALWLCGALSTLPFPFFSFAIRRNSILMFRRHMVEHDGSFSHPLTFLYGVLTNSCLELLIDHEKVRLED